MSPRRKRVLNRVYDRDGNPISMERWRELYADRDYVIVKQEDIDEGHWLSTVWLGLDHGWGGTLKIFESMIFNKDPNGDSDWQDLECRRYSTLREAQEGHEALKREWRAAMLQKFKEALNQHGGIKDGDL